MPPSASVTTSQPVVAHGQSGATTLGGNAAREQYGVRQVDYQQILGPDLADGRSLDAPIYFDANGDGVDEALLVAHGTGDIRPADWFLFGEKNGNVVKIFEHTAVAHGEISLQGSTVIEKEGIFGSGDADCCPSSTKRTEYVWRDGSLVVSRIEVLPAAS